MPWSVSISVAMTGEVDPAAGIAGWEQAVQDAGREAMRQALAQAVRVYEEQHWVCPQCGSPRNQRRAGTPPHAPDWRPRRAGPAGGGRAGTGHPDAPAAADRPRELILTHLQNLTS